MATETSRTNTKSTTRRRSTSAKRNGNASARNDATGAAATPVQINTEDIAQLEAGRALLVSQLEEAHGNELAALTTLSAHAAMTPTGQYRTLLERHHKETRAQADRLQDRLVELGATRGPLSVGYGAATAVVSQAFALTKGPIDLIRGRAGEEKLFKNAKDEIITEASEIANYDGIEATALAVGDTKTAELASSIREQEQAMFDALREQLPALASATVRSLAAGDKSYDISSTGAAQAARKLGNEAAGEVREARTAAKQGASRARRTTKRTASTTRSKAKS